LDPHASPSLIMKVFGWFSDFIAMPGRVKRLDADLTESSDARLKCPSCGTGRIGDLHMISPPAMGGHQVHQEAGICSSCHKTYWLQFNPPRVDGMIQPSYLSHLPRHWMGQ